MLPLEAAAGCHQMLVDTAIYVSRSSSSFLLVACKRTNPSTQAINHCQPQPATAPPKTAQPNRTSTIQTSSARLVLPSRASDHLRSVTMEAQKQSNQAFLSLAPTQSPPASPTATKATSAISSPVDNKAHVPTDAIEPLQRLRTDSSSSSSSSKSTGFLRLNPDAED